MSDEIKLPTTVEEYQRERRAAYVAGRRATIPTANYMGQAEAEARKRYPITKRVPREVRLAGGVVVRWDDGHLRFIDPDDRKPYPLTCIGSASLDALRDLLANPFEEVDE